MKPAHGGQRVGVTIPVSPGTNALGDTLSYRWDTGVDGGARCQPGALPDLSGVTAGTVIDALLARPVNCERDPPSECEFYKGNTQRRLPIRRIHHWETDDNTFYAWPSTRKEALRMTALVEDVLRSGPYHGKDWPGRAG